MRSEHVDVLIVGAGLSGIGAACFLRRDCPGKTFAVLEMREASGGTWNLFRYPGVRSDSDMHTLGYAFRPWIDDRVIADGASILDYIRATAREHDIERHIRYSQRLVRASWSTSAAQWRVEVEHGGDTPRLYTCRFLHLCTGYYDYTAGFTPDFPGQDAFTGRIVHPQAWPADLDWTGQRMVVIGSGATAVTLVPALAVRAQHVTMLQRSPSYVLSLPSTDPVARQLRRWLPRKLAYALTRWKNVLLNQAFYQLARRRPQWVKRVIRKRLARLLGEACDMRHFTPAYNPWDQRLCLVPDADLPKAIRSGKASVVTDRIERITPSGVLLASGVEIEADLIVTATGLALQMAGGAHLVVDGSAIDLAKHTVYKGMMLSDIPNLAFAVGYTNAAWTLKCDLVAQYVCRLLQHMDRLGLRQCTPRIEGALAPQPLIDFTSTYVLRDAAVLPTQGDRAPWRLRQNYALDLMALRHGRLDDGMVFSNPAPERAAADT